MCNVNYCNDVFRGTPQSDGTVPTWTADLTLNSDRTLASAVAFGGEVYLVGGGINQGNTLTNTISSSLINENTTLSGWIESYVLSTARFRTAAVVSNDGWIYVIEGSTNTGNTLPSTTYDYGPTANAGATAYAPSGTYLSDIIDLGTNRDITGLDWNTTVTPTVVTMTLKYRAGNSIDLSGVPWSTSVAQAGLVFTNSLSIAQNARYFQYHASFSRTLSDAGVTPVLNRVRLNYNEPPTIATQPSGSTVNVGQSVSFTAGANGSPTPTVQWQVSTDGGATWTDIPGATSTTLTFTAQSSQNGYKYRAVFTNSLGTATTNSATLTTTTLTNAYSMLTNDQPGGPALAWIDATDGTNSNITGDDNYGGPFPLGFAFLFYNNVFTEVYFSTNGLVNFGHGSAAYINTSLPNSNTPNNLLAVLWDDLQVVTPQTIYYKQGGTAPNRYFVVEWYNVSQLGNASYPLTFEAVLYENGTILFQYQSLSDALDSNSVGIEDSMGNVGLQYVFNQTGLRDGLAIAFTPLFSADVTVSKALVSDPSMPEANATYLIEYRNNGPIPASQVMLTDSLPVEMSFVSASSAVSPTIVGNSLVWDLGTLPELTTGAISLTVSLPNNIATGTVLTNTVAVSASNDSYAGNNNAIDAHVVQVPTRDVSVSKSLSSGSLVAGQEITYTIYYGNYGNAAARNVVLTDTLPAGTTFITATRWGWQAFPPDRINGNQLAWDVGTLNSYSGGDLQVCVRISETLASGTSLVNMVDIATNDSETSYDNNHATDVRTALGLGVDLTVNKYPWQPAVQGNTIQYEINYRNNLGSVANSVTITDVLPSGMSVESAWSYSSWSVITSTNVVTWTRSTVNAEESGSVYLTARVDGSVPVGIVLTNTVGITATEIDAIPDNNVYLWPATVVAPTRDLYVNKYLYSGTPTVGEEITYAVSYRNYGNSSASNVVLTDTLPVGTTFVTATRSSWMGSTPFPPDTITGNQLVWNLGILSAYWWGDPIQIRVRISDTFAAGALLTNAVEIATGDAETNYDNNSASDTRSALGLGVDLSISKAIWGQEGVPGSRVDYRINYANSRGGTASNVVITDALPSGMTVESEWHNWGWSALTGTNAVTWTIPSLSGGESGFLWLVARIDNSVASGTVLTNTVGITTTSADTTPDNNVYFYPIVVATPYRDLFVSKNRSGGSPVAGQEITYTIYYRNDGNVPASNVVLTDTLPAGTTFISATLGGWQPLPPDAIVGDRLVWNLGTANNGWGYNLQVRIRISDTVAVGTNLVNAVEIATSDPETDYLNNQATHIQTVLGAGVDLRVTLSTSGRPAFPGDWFEYSIKYRNNLGNAASNVAIVDVLPPGMTVESDWHDWRWSVFSSTNVVTWTIPSLAGAELGTMLLRARIDPGTPAGTVLTNTVRITTTDTETNYTNNVSSLATTVRPVIPGRIGWGTPESCVETFGKIITTGGLITFDCGSQPVTLTLPSTVEFQNDTTIDGGGLITLAGNGATMLFSVDPIVTLGLQNITVTNGSNLTGSGGAIYNRGTVAVTNTTFVANNAGGGGAIFNDRGGTLRVNESTFSLNMAAREGGGIFNLGTLTVTASTFMNNSAVAGAGIFNGGTATIFNSTFANNTAAGSVGGSGGAIYNTGTLSAINATIANNSATASAGGIYNNSGSVTLKNTLIAHNTAGGNCAGVITDGGNNLQFNPDTGCGSTIPAADPKLDPTGLQSNGGRTRTIALQAASAAIDAGDNAICAAAPVNNLDQRGMTRPIDGDGNGLATCDIGAFEVPAALANFMLAATPSSNSVSPGQSITYTIQLTATNGFTSPVSLSVTGLPSFADATFKTNPVVPSASTVMTVTTVSTATVGMYSLTIVGNSGSITHAGGVTLTINNPLPTLTSISPVSATAGGPSFTLVLTGTNFVSGSIARWSGGNLTTVFGSSTRLTATLPSANIASAGLYTITVFNPSPGGGESNSIGFNVNKANSTTAITSSVSPSVWGQPVTLTATVNPVAPAAGTPSGIVTFKDGANVLVTRTLTSGMATFITSTLAVGSHAIAAEYSGDGTYNPSTGTLVGGQVITRANSTLSVTSSKPSSTFGEPVMFTATVSVTAPVVSALGGTVQFADNGTPISVTLPLSSNIVTYTTAALGVGTHVISATYTGDTNFNGSAAEVTQVVSKANTRATITGNTPHASLFGQSVTFTATVTSTQGIPTGSVAFKEGATMLVTGTLSNGIANANLASLPAGSHVITAEYSGDVNFDVSVSTPVTQTVSKANTATTITANVPSASVFGQLVTFTATVTSTQGIPTGTVLYKEGTTTLVTSTLISGTANANIDSLSVGTHAITATFSGDSNFNASTSLRVTQVVTKANTTTSITSNLPNPSVFGQAVTFTTTVTAAAPGAGIPSGVVTFKDGATTLGTATLDPGGTATYITSTLTVTNNPDAITATYGGDAKFNASTSVSVTQTVTKANTIAATSAFPNPSTWGQSVTFTATVNAQSPGAGTPTGTIRFKDGTTVLVTKTLASGTATFITSTLSVGNHPINVEYSGDSNFNAITGTLSGGQIVNPAPTATTVTSSVNPSLLGQPVTFTATVTSTVGTPSGTVQFKVDGNNLGPAVALVSGKATSRAVSTLTAGNHVVTAVYSGDGNFSPSTGTLSGGQQVNSPIPTLNGLNPNSATAASAGFVLTVSGINFVNGAIARWDGVDLPTTFVNSTTLTATVQASKIITTGTAYVTVANPPPGGGISNPKGFWTSSTGATITSSDAGASSNITGTVTVSTTVTNGVTATASGSGTVGVAQYTSNPGTPSFSTNTGAYIDVHVAAGSSFTSLTIVNCNLNGGNVLYWWNGSGWLPASQQTFNPTTHCITVTVNASTSPNLSDLTGTPLAPGVDTTAPSTNATATTGGAPYTFGNWTKQDVTVTLTATDNVGGSGSKQITYGAIGAQAISTTTVPLTTTTFPLTNEGVTTLRFYATDFAANSGTTQTALVGIDKTAPAITITVPAHGATYPQNQAVSANYSCSDLPSSANSGVTTCSGPVASGATLDTNSLGQKSFTVNATDSLGNTISRTNTYTVTAPSERKLYLPFIRR